MLDQLVPLEVLLVEPVQARDVNHELDEYVARVYPLCASLSNGLSPLNSQGAKMKLIHREREGKTNGAFWRGVGGAVSTGKLFAWRALEKLMCEPGVILL